MSDDKKVISFPKKSERKSIKKDKKRTENEVAKLLKQQDELEKEYRAQYHAQKRADNAMNMGNMARKSAYSGKVPFVNWHKIPIFTRIAVGVFLAVQVILSLFISASHKVMIIYYFGFVPAFYSGAVPWEWSAMIAPFTSLIIHGGWMHLAFNIVMMLAMGIFFERQFGAKLTAIFFVLCGLIGNLTCFILSPESLAPIIGASGSISGLFAVSCLIMIEGGLLGGDAQRRGSLPFILLWSFLIVGLGMLSNDVSWQSHIGGFLGGVGLFHLWKKNLP